jgi:hypothetical protein
MLTRTYARTRGQTTDQGYLQLYILHTISSLAYRRLRALKMPESSNKEHFDTEKFITELERIFGIGTQVLV